VVVDYAAGLHPGVDDDGAYEFEASFFEGCRDLFGERRFGWDVGHAFAFALNGFAPSHRPDPGGEVFAGGFHVEVDAGSGDGGFDLGAGTDDAGVGEEALDVGLVEAGDLPGVEVAEGLAEGVALAQDGEPGKASLEAVEHELLPERAAVVLGDAPLFVVVGLHERIVFGPGAAGVRCGFRHWVPFDLTDDTALE